MKSLAVIGTITIIILSSLQAQSNETIITFPTQNNILERDSIAPKTTTIKKDIDPFPISEAEMIEYNQASYPSLSENNAVTNMDWALAKSDTSNKEK